MKDAKGHGSDAHSDGVQQIGQSPLTPTPDVIAQLRANAQKFRPATDDDVVRLNKFNLDTGHPVQFRHFVRELYSPNSKSGVQHREYSRSKLSVIGGIPPVKYQGKMEPVTGTVYRLDSGKEILHDLRLNSPHLGSPWK